eukprot:6333623-Pyramimonas_sp.AAC.1
MKSTRCARSARRPIPSPAVWECPDGEVAESRAQLVPASIITAALAALSTEASSEDICLCARGAFAHPAGWLPRPALEGANSLVYARHRAELLSPEGPRAPANGGVCGRLFIDGSCRRRPIRELSRAA